MNGFGRRLHTFADGAKDAVGRTLAGMSRQASGLGDALKGAARLADTLKDQPPTTYRCAKCGKVVARFHPDGHGKRKLNYSVRDGEPFTCPEHGRLDDTQDTGKGGNVRLPPVG
ncbi:hypothetical protein [Tenggerimyces flavus]|uniref:Uncharacterized protein n=1 Tax=Tenggerimyces flavus TaxID=1708749 RepID=A0ABV7YL92_9ACTN|nr:hypothetical protein [Tenggerimyces flavus]MBM7787776.1 DNA-directed RNA polymerase subunit RPC12/RpoP [Tenggerimyces flavus]